MSQLDGDSARREDRPWIVYLTHRVPYPPDRGDRIRTYQILRYLARRARVLLGCLADEPATDEQRRVLGELCAEVCIVDNRSSLRWLRGVTSMARGQTISEGVFYHPALARQLTRWLTQFPVGHALFSATSFAPYVRLAVGKHVPCIVDSIDVDSQKWLDYAATFRGWKRWIYQREGRCLRRVEQRLAHEAQAVTLVSDAERELFRTITHEGQALTIPNGVDLEYFSPQPEPTMTPSCVFIGVMDYPPNIDAVVWFAEHVWPLILARQPAARFEIVGRRPTPAVQRLSQHRGIRVVGEVPDVRTYVSEAAVVVAPLRIARGIQNKVLEAFAMAKPVIASSGAMEGLDVSDGIELLRADQPQEWVDDLLTLWSDPQRRRDLGRAGRAYVEAHHSWDRCLEEFSRLLQLPA